MIPGLRRRRRLPMYFQAEDAECGLTCLSMVAAFHGQPSGPAALRRDHGASLRGATLRDLVRAGAALGLAARPVRFEIEELSRLRTPCILHWDLDHFVVLRSVGRTTVVVHDPAEGVRRLPLSAASRHITGVALELVPTAGFKRAPGPVPRVRLRSLVGHIAGLRRTLATLLLLALAIEVLALLGPLYVGLAIDHAILREDRDLLRALALGFGVLLLMQTAVEALRGWILMALGASLKVQARTNLFAHLMTLPAAWFEARPVADVLSRFGSQDSILRALTRDLVVAVLDGFMAVATFAVMALLAPQLALLVLGGGLLYALLRWAAYGPLRHASAEALVWAARRDGHFLETLRAIRSVKLLNAQDDRRVEWANLMVETVNRQLVTERLGLLLRAGNALLVGGLGIGVVWLAAQEILVGGFTVGLLFAFLSYQALFMRRVSGLIDTAVDLRMLGLHAERLSDIALTPPDPGEIAAFSHSARRGRPAAIEVRGLGFRYGPHDPWVLRDLNLRVEAGEWVAIAGPSGCGKSTLLKLLAGLLEPTYGTILVDGEPLRREDLRRWRDRLGVVLQDDALFAGSIADNIAARAGADPARVEDAARRAALHDDVAALPMAYATRVGDLGAALSGGQAQRLLLARALYRRPDLLLLDEATSHLDVLRERAVNEALAATTVTRIVIAHRPDTIRAAGRVVRLDPPVPIPRASSQAA